MRIIGLTGSIACGKSTLSQAIRDAGWPVIDGDVLSRECTAPQGPALPAICAAFGDQVFTQDGQLNRKKLGQLVFSDPRSLDRLNHLMAPFLRSLTEQRLAEARASGSDLCFLEMPLLFEAGYDALCDTVWCVWLPESLQLERLMARDGISEEAARQRIASVLSSDEKASRSQVVLDNSGEPGAFLARLPDLLANELRLSAPRRRRSARYEAEPSPSGAAGSGDARPALDPVASGGVGSGSNVPALGSVSSGSAGSGYAEPALGPVGSSAGAPAPGYGPVHSPINAEVGIERPAALRKQRSARQVSWRLPSWLMVLLISCVTVLAVSFTAQLLMKAYLTRRQDQHLAEQQAIDANYPLLYQDLIEEYAQQYNLRPAYVAAIIRNESSFRADAESSVGARGLMQLMPDTAEWIAHKLKTEGFAFERMYDPASNIHFGCWYLNYLSGLFQGDPVAVTCAYHAGQGEITSWLSDSRYSTDGRTLTLDRLPEGPTKQYAGRVTRDDGIYQAKYFSPAAVLSDDHDADLRP